MRFSARIRDIMAVQYGDAKTSIKEHDHAKLSAAVLRSIAYIDLNSPIAINLYLKSWYYYCLGSWNFILFPF